MTSDPPPPSPGNDHVPFDSVQAGAEQFRLLVESATDYAIFLLDPYGRVVSWNSGAQRIKGYRAEEIVGRHFSLFYTPEDLARQHPAQALQTARDEGRFQEEGWRVRKDGSRFLANVIITALHGPDGMLRGFSKITRDLTAQREQEQERLQRAREQIAHSFLRDILLSVTEGKLHFCASAADLPPVAASTDPWFNFSQMSLCAVRRHTLGIARAAGHSQNRQQDLVTAVGEAAMNAVVHAGSARARIGVTDSGTVQVWIEDEGAGIDIARLPRATLERGFTTAGSLGHGFWLMLQTCDRLWLLTGPEGTTLTLEQDREQAEPQWLRLVA